MISIDKAQELKAAGLKWKPEYRDIYHRSNPQTGKANIVILNKQAIADPHKSNLTWLPSLSQLLAEIEARYPYLWQVGRVENGRYKIALMDEGYNVTSFDANTPEDAAASALLWILKEAGE